MVKTKLTHDELNIAAAMYQEGLKMEQIAKIYGLTKQAVSERFIKAGIPRRSRGRPKKGER